MARRKPFGGHTGSLPNRGPYSTWITDRSNPLKAARVKAKLTQQQLAAVLDIDRARIAQWESGARPWPRPGSLERDALDQWLTDQDEASLPADTAHRCKICDRVITDPESIARGIGPECALK